MDTPIQINNRPARRLIPALILVSLLLIVGAACTPASPPSGEQATPGVVDTQPTPTTAAASATSEAVEIPAGWSTYSSQLCGYEISYPPEMQVTSQGPYSLTLGYQPDQPENPVPYFVYLSVIDPEIQRQVAAGVYDYEVYNYNPAEAEILLDLQVGESAALHEITGTALQFTYLRQPDTMISGYAAQTYENQQPWGFPGGTKEIRYFLPLETCTLLMGGYLANNPSNQAGAITQELFQQIVATLQIKP